jgi:hypothetical protein
MNDNRRLIVASYAAHHLPDAPHPCACGSDAVGVDSRTGRSPFFVWCAGCGREGPERPTYDLAVTRWNSDPSYSGPPTHWRVVDNNTT